MNTAFSTLAVLSLLALTACQPNNSSPAPNAAPDTKAILGSDISTLQGLDFSSGASYSNFEVNGKDYFSLIFGGRTGAAMKNYLDARLHYYFSMDELQQAETSDSNSSNTGWSNNPGEDQKLKKAGGEIGALNVGTGLWFQGLLDGVTPVVKISGQVINVNSSRVGIMVIGSGYRTSLSDESGDSITLPAAYRISILLHEARHSDCTGGVTQADLQVARAASSEDEFDSKYPAFACGHLHVKCPEGHELAGIAACDKEAWGAYSVESVFAAESAHFLTDRDQRIMEAVAADALSRVLVDTNMMVRGELGDPDMSSAGLRN